MKNKKSKIFLLIGFGIFLISVILMVISVVVTYNMVEVRIKTEFPNDARMLSQELGIVLLSSLWVYPAILAEQLAWIRSTYKLLKYNPSGFTKVCYMIASGISLFAMVLHLLMFTGIINFDKIMPYKINPQFMVFLISPYIATILSFLIGSMPVKNKSVNFVDE